MSRRQPNRPSQGSATIPSDTTRLRARIPIGLLFVLLTTCIVYLPAMSGGMLWDDDAHITKPELQSLNGLRRIWVEPGATQQYYPLLHSAFWVEHLLWGDSVRGYHAINLIWHLIAVALVYVILTKLKISGALLAAAIFALHPVMVESVAWITEQKNTLSTVFYLAAMLVYLQFDESRRRANYTIAFVLFVLGLLTKTVTATLPAALLVIFWWQRGTLSWKRDILPLLPLFVLGGAAGLATAWVERKLIGAEGADFDLTFLQHCLLAGRVIWFYIAKLLWPANLIFIYPRWQVDPAVRWQWLCPAAAVAVTLALWSIRRTSRGPLAGWLFFVGTLFPVLGFLNVYPFLYAYVADHFQYLASLGLIVPAAAGITLAVNRRPQTSHSWSTAVCVLLIGTLAALTWQQSRMYADNLALYRATLQRNPDCWMAHFNVAWLLAEAGHPDEAIEHYRAAIRLRPNYAEAHNNLGRLLINSNELPEAINEFQKTIELRPDHYHAFNNLGVAFDHQGRYPEAIESLKHSIQLYPNFPDAYQNLGNTLMRMGQLAAAIENIEHALQLKPDDSEAHNNLGVVLVQAGRVPQAIEHFRQAVALSPQDPKAHANLGKTLLDTANYEEAIAQLQQALQLQPDRADLHNCLGDAFRATGCVNQAIEHCQTALRLDPNLAEAYLSLAQSLALAKRTDEAMASAKRGIAVANSISQPDAAAATAEWLKKYRAEIENPGRNRTAPPSPAGTGRQ